MKREDLTKLGLTDEAQIDAIMAANGHDIEKHKAEALTSKQEADAIKAQLAEATKAIEGFKGLDIEGVKKSADEWKLKAESSQAEYDKKLADMKFDTALEKALTGAKVKDPVSVRAHLKLADMKLNEDGSILGFNEQIEPLKTSKDFLFESDTPTPQIVLGGNNKTILSDKVIDAARSGAGLPQKQ